MGLLKRMMNQFREPRGRFGRIVVRIMNKGHAKMATWGLTHISLKSNDIILDVGCGGGRDVRSIAEVVTEGKVYGIDYSEIAVEISKKSNRKFIETGRVDIQHASVSSLPFDNDFFDVVTGFETYYFWPDLISDLKEIYRIIKPGGTLLLVNEGYKCENENIRKRNEKWARLGNFTIHAPGEFRELLEKSGYCRIEIFEEINKGWIAIKGTKRSASATD